MQQGFVRLGFIGLGVMGEPMAGHLLQAGYPVAVYDPLAEPMARLAELGATCCSCAQQVAEQAVVVFVAVRDERQVEDVLFGGSGVAAGLQPGGTVVIISSIPAATMRTLGQRLQALDIALLDAPVSGGRAGARAANLAIMVGGDEARFAELEPVLQQMGNNITRVGALGCGQTAKSANQIIVALTRAAVGEALLFAASDGADPETVRRALLGGHAQSLILEDYGARIAATDQPIEFASHIIRKDLANLGRVTEKLGLQLPFSDLARQKYLDAVNDLNR